MSSQYSSARPLRTIPGELSIPLYYSNTRYAPTDGGAAPAAKQCYMFLSALENAHGPVGNSTPVGQWIVHTDDS
ncbi:hypothetical protein ACN38_g3066 [Penicillium nordicum]|uniref:Uncharacterized protein n=1 Tax=Penicillium nordicum TaxID=229535 RepID=A0A0M9WIB2_9EURO|nr:hypothetical protein ACN38_g3066 [Penicillium nordicum]